tara:strand:- start:2658 stop:3497 length:840 start_codon:yes stop_codon:yes gene_type:complete
MALTPQVRASQLDVTSVTDATPDIRASQFDVYAVAIGPTEFIEASQVDVTAVTDATPDIRASQLDVMVVGRGRVADPYLRVWVYELDDHWFYVLRLPTGYTLVLDLTTEQWSIYGSGEGTSWRPTHGTNWLGSGSLMGTYGSNVVCGDDGNGALYFLNPLSVTDDSAIDGAADPQTFLRRITGQITVRGNDYHSCYGVELMGSIGESSETDITLYSSDDIGHTFNSHGTVSVTQSDYTARVEWVSGLGSYTGPGRLFRVDDYGALQRIDYLEMSGDEDG